MRQAPRIHQEAAPLWTPDSVPVGTPFPSATPGPVPDASPSPTSSRVGEGDQAGLVVPAHPIGRVSLQAPAFNALKTGYIEAQFEVAVDGSSQVTLLERTGNSAADDQVLAYLKGIRWAPKTIGGVPTSDIQTMDFTVER